MKTLLAKSAGLALALCMNSCGQADQTVNPELEVLWENKQFEHPESIVLDRDQGVFYISNIAGGEKGDGYIAVMDKDGSNVRKLTSGLDNPKGMALSGGALFVSDERLLHKIDVHSGEIIATAEHKDVVYLNDVSADDDGNIYVADMHASAVYKWAVDGSYGLWMKSSALRNPNGLQVKDNNMLVAAWGAYNNGNPLSAEKGGVLKVRMDDQRTSNVGPELLGNLDGVQALDNGQYMASEWIEGKLYFIAPDGKAHELKTFGQSLADILYLPEEQILICPVDQQNTITACKLKF